MKPWSLAAQRKRQAELYAWYRSHMRSCVDASGAWHGTDREMGFREKVWHTFGLLAGGEADVELANSILRTVQPKPCHFTPMSCLQLLLKHGPRLAPDVTERLKAYVAASLPHAADPRVHFTMYNDNFASLACFTLIVGGEMLGDQAAFKAGMAKLEGMRDLFRRRGTVMEYGSPTYTPVNAHVIAELATYARDPTAKDLARDCEVRMWAEIATHWHAETSRLAGPYSRAYWVDTAGHPHLIHALMYLVFGEAIFSNPVAELSSPYEKLVIHIGRETLMMPNFAWLWSGTCRVPDRLARLALRKRYPFEVSCTSESLPSRISGNRTFHDGRKERFDGPEYPAFAGPNTSYLTADFALGAAFSSYHDGPFTETFHLTWRKRRPARRLADTGVAVSRYIFNDKLPERRNYYSVFDSVHGPEGFRDEGRKWGLQHRGCALYAYRPKPFEAHEVASMKLAILLPTHFAPIEEVRLGDRRFGGERVGDRGLEGHRGGRQFGGTLNGAPTLSAAPLESVDPCAVLVKDGPVYLAFVPLALTDHGRRAAVRIESWENYLAICLYNYEGPVRSFDVPTVMRTSNGFVVHAASDAEFPDLEAFAKFVNAGTVSDETTESEDGYTRWIAYTHPAVSLRLALSPASEGILTATIDGRPRPEPIFAASGLSARWLPFLE